MNAIRNGGWVLLDEINLASTETLECLSGLLESEDGSIVLVERGLVGIARVFSKVILHLAIILTTEMLMVFSYLAICNTDKYRILEILNCF